MFDVKLKRVEDQKKKLKEETAMEAQNYELDREDEFIDQKQKISQKLKNEWQAQKRAYEQEEQARQTDYSSILAQIKESKNKVRKLQ